jgi:hypothetical protein
VRIVRELPRALRAKKTPPLTRHAAPPRSRLKAQAALVAGARSRAAPPASEVNLGGKLRAVCQLFFPARITPRQALKARSHVLKRQLLVCCLRTARADGRAAVRPFRNTGAAVVRADAGPRQSAS